jgi:putative flavoprotein involved in K+ transport
MAWHLAQQGRRFVVLEAGSEVGHIWRDRWDSLKLFTPAQYDALPGMAFPAPADTYPTKDPVADYLQVYAKAFDLPVRLNAKVTELRRLEDGSFEVHTAEAATGLGRWWWLPGRSRFPSARRRPVDSTRR